MRLMKKMKQKDESYYLKKYITFQLVEYAKNRELAIIPYARGLQIRNATEIENILFDLINWNKKKTNLYISCAKIKSIPNFTWNMKERSEFTSQWFEKDFDNLLYEYDLFLDFDSTNQKKVKEDVSTIKEFLDEDGVPYQIIFSGNKGYHIVIDGKYLHFEKIEEGLVYPQKKIAENIKEALQLETLDLANNGITNRLRKLPYTLVLPKQFENERMRQMCPEKMMRVALPLSDIEFEKFKPEDAIFVNVMRTTHLMDRGLMERQGTKENVDKFIKRFR